VNDHIHREVKIQSTLENAGFESFPSTLEGMVHLIDRCITHMIAGRFWGTININPFSFGEMTITPFDFAMLMGLGFSEDLLVYQKDFDLQCDHLSKLFGPHYGKCT